MLNLDFDETRKQKKAQYLIKLMFERYGTAEQTIEVKFDGE